ncbi:MAG: transglutaminase-like domain-containing protein [Verrucomicrobiota bacterium]
MKILRLIFPTSLLCLAVSVAPAEVEYVIDASYSIETRVDEKGNFVCTSISVPAFDKEVKELGKQRDVKDYDILSLAVKRISETDRKSVTADLLVTNHTEAIAARETHSWSRAVPTDIFLNDVLPYACLDETRDNWRADFRKRFAPMVADTKTLREAALIINQRIRGELKVEYNTKREKACQSPYESMKQDMASCTGLSILLCDVFRSVGIPARIVGTSWIHKPGNHTWVEFYDPETKQWHFTEYDPDKNGFDRGWLVADAARAISGDPKHAVYATSWRWTGKSFPLPWDADNQSVHAINVTERYLAYGKATVEAAAGKLELRIDFRDAGGNRVSREAEVLSGNTVIATGKTPGPTADANSFFTVHISRQSEHQVTFENGETITIKNVAADKQWLNIEGR